MRELPTRDGSIHILNDDDDQGIVVTPHVDRFEPLLGAAHCACGAAIKSWGMRDGGSNVIELGCPQCNRPHAFITLCVETEPAPASVTRRKAD